MKRLLCFVVLAIFIGIGIARADIATVQPSGGISVATDGVVTLSETAVGKIFLIGTHTTPETTTPYTLTAANAYGRIIFYGATGTINLPAGVTGMSIVIYNTGAFTITIDPDGTEVVVRDGTVQTGGVSFTLSSGAGNYVTLVNDGTRWITLGYKGTLAVGS